MKKLLFVLFLLQLLPIVSRAATEINLIYYNLDSSNKTAEVTSGSNKYTGSVTIPKTVNYNGVDYSVTSIGYSAFEDCGGLNSVTFPNSVAIIGDRAFQYCWNLTSVTIPNSVTSIGDDAFNGCSSLTSVTIPNSVTTIGEKAFSYCSDLTSVTIPNSVKSIGNAAFSGCSGLTSIVVDAVNSKYDSRNNCNAIIVTSSNTLIAGCKNTVIPNSVKSIGDCAFRGCRGLTSVTIPNSVKSIGNWAFEYCSGFTSVTIPNNVTSIGIGAFKDCSGLTSIVVDAANSDYDSRDNCNAIIVTLSNTLIAGCKNTVIPNSVTSIGTHAFDGCRGLTSVTIPNSVTRIGNAAFQGCSGMLSVIISNSVTSIGAWAFNACSGLTSVSIPNSVTNIGESTFYQCSGLTSITIPNGVTSIGDRAFGSCSDLTSVTIPNSVTSIGNYAFYNYSSKLTDVFCRADHIPATQDYTFNSSKISNVTLHVPASAVDAYSSTAPWSGFGTIVPIEEDEDDLQSYLNSLEDTEDSFDGSTYRREFKNGDWQALYVPFEMNYSDCSAKFDVARISEYESIGQIGSGLDGFVLRASMVESGKVEANYPYLIRAKSKTGAKLTVQVNESIEMISNYIQVYNHTYIRGNYNKMYKLMADGYYRLQGGKLSIPNSDSELLPPYRWYLAPPRNMASRITIEINGEETTNIRNAATDADVDSPTVYDLQGRKVSNGTQLKNGIYIVNGKKQVINQKR